MRELNVASYAEGSTDHLFLSPLIQRTINSLLTEKGSDAVEVNRQITAIKKFELKQEECIQEAACWAVNYDLLIIHCDADAPVADKALKERYFPGYKRVQQMTGGVCKSLIPLVPIRMTEAWILAAELALFKQILYTSMSARDLGLVNKVKQVEADLDPKQTLKQIAQTARAHVSRRHRGISHEQIYGEFGRCISLARLQGVPSYKQFVDDLTQVLREMQLLS